MVDRRGDDVNGDDVSNGRAHVVVPLLSLDEEPLLARGRENV